MKISSSAAKSTKSMPVASLRVSVYSLALLFSDKYQPT
jgi:hypothetical protein